MNKDKLLDLIRKKIHTKFPEPSHKNAAEYFNVSRHSLSHYLNGVTKDIPQCLLDFAGYKLREPSYIKSEKTNTEDD